MTKYYKKIQPSQKNFNPKKQRVKKYNFYVVAFVVDRIDLKKITEDLVVLKEINASRETDVVHHQDNEWLEDRAKPEMEIDDELQQSYNLTNLYV